MIYNITYNDQSEIHAFCVVCGKVNIFQKDDATVNPMNEDKLLHDYYKVEHDLCLELLKQATPMEQLKLGTVIIGVGKIFKDSDYRIDPKNIREKQFAEDMKQTQQLLF